MERIRALLVSLAQIMMVVVIVFGTLAGFFVGGSSRGIYGGFSLLGALMGGVAGFLASGVSMSVLAILLDIRAALLRIQTKGGVL